MLAVHLATVRLFLHVVAATVWVGGQFTLAALVPVLRRAAPQAVRLAARAYAWIAWPAFAVLVATGAWNIAAEQARVYGAYRTTLIVKLVAVLVSGGAAAAHARSSRPVALAIYGALAALAALAAVFYGVLLAG